MEPETFVTSAGQPETSADDARRQRQREKQARYRAKKRQAGDGDDSPGTRHRPRDPPPNRPHVTRDPGATGHDADADEIAQWVTRLVDDRLQAFLGDAMPRVTTATSPHPRQQRR